MEIMSNMIILQSNEQHLFLAFLPAIRNRAEEWQLVTFKINAKPEDSFDASIAADIICKLFAEKEGRIFLCNHHELLMVVREGRNPNPAQMTKRIEDNLPSGRCDVQIQKPTAENLGRFKIQVNFDEVENLSESARQRCARTENVILIADDDMYTRTLVRKGIDPTYTIYEVIHGSEIVSAYKKYVPDILFLDIHMPGKDGLKNLELIKAFDPQAYAIMLSADSSPENVLSATKAGAKGFLAKPLVKDRLIALVQKCPTIR